MLDYSRQLINMKTPFKKPLMENFHNPTNNEMGNIKFISKKINFKNLENNFERNAQNICLKHKLHKFSYPHLIKMG
jgi:hypothetical protein